MGARIAIILVALGVVGMPAKRASQTPPGFGHWCGLRFEAETRERRVYGDIAVECGNCVGHTAPFGNWGVASWYSMPTDAWQYQGWQDRDHPCLWPYGGFLNTPE